MDTAVGLVKAYLEFCGYFVLSELPVSERLGSRYRDATDLDIIAIRFPHPPAELPHPGARALDVFLSSDPMLETNGEAVDVIIGEVKEGRGRLNRALSRK